jgi:excisionase family DNA binding protein
MEADGLLSVQDTAAVLQVSPRTVRRLIDRGALTPIRVGATLAIRFTDIPGLSRPERSADGPQQRLLTVHEAAARLGCAPRTVRSLAARGQLRTIQIGGTKRWSPSDVEALRRTGVTDVG